MLSRSRSRRKSDRSDGKRRRKALTGQKQSSHGYAESGRLVVLDAVCSREITSTDIDSCGNSMTLR